MRHRGALVVAVASVLAPFVLTDVVARYTLAEVAALALAATGLGFVSGIGGQLSLGHGALMSAGAYTSALLVMRGGWPFWLAAVAGVLAALLLGLAFAAPSLRVGGQYLALVTLGFAYIAYQVTGQAESLTGGFGGLPGIPSPSLFGHELGSLGIALLGGVALAVAVLFVAAVRASAPGRAVAAVREGDRGAAGSGIEPFRVKVAAFGLSAVFAGAGGVVFAHSQGLVSPDIFGLQLSLLLLVMVVLGGARPVTGPAVGAAVVLLPRALVSGFGRYELLVFGVVALAFVILRPEGLAGLRPRRTAARTEAARFGTSVPAVGPGAALEVRGLSVRFGGLAAVDDVSFEVTAGTIHALVGPNGSGKTTLIDACTGVRDPGAGRVVVDGAEVGRGPSGAAGAGIARTFQEANPFPGLPCLEVVLLGASARAGQRFVAAGFGAYRAREAALRTEASELLAAVGLGGLEDAVAGTLSLGESKRLELARALMSHPRVLFLDEPAAGLAAGEVEELEGFLRRLRDAGATVVLVEHHMDLVMRLADRVTVLDAGRVVATGSPAAVRRRPDVIEAYLG
jgi:ABC-type branched-subunit amino acid transport system ATPase component/ABC-type branched-subunit amino acid transport system permease subunit